MIPDDLSQEDFGHPSCLGVLALLGAALRVSRWVLLARHPELAGSPITRPRRSRAASCARRVVHLTLELDTALLTYRNAIPPAIPPSAHGDSIPF